MKKLITAVLALAVASSLCACQARNNTILDGTYSQDYSLSAESEISGTNITIKTDDYSFTVDKLKWTEHNVDSMDFTYGYIGGSTDESAATIIGFQTIAKCGSLKYKLDEVAQTMRTTYLTQGMIVESSGKTVLNGNAAYQFTLIDKSDNITLKQYLVQTGSNLIAVNYTYYPSSYNEIQGEVEKVLNSIKLLG